MPDDCHLHKNTVIKSQHCATSLTHTHAHTLTLSHSCTHPLAHTLTRTPSLSRLHSHTHTLTVTHTPSLSRLHSHAHTLTHTYTHQLLEELARSLKEDENQLCTTTTQTRLVPSWQKLWKTQTIQQMLRVWACVSKCCRWRRYLKTFMQATILLEGMFTRSQVKRHYHSSHNCIRIRAWNATKLMTLRHFVCRYNMF
jgi:hypothetical protein